MWKWIKSLFGKVKALKKKVEKTVDLILDKVEDIEKLLDENNVDEVRNRVAVIKTYLEILKRIL